MNILLLSELWLVKRNCDNLKQEFLIVEFGNLPFDFD